MPEPEYSIDDRWWPFLHYAGNTLIAQDVSDGRHRFVDTYPIYMRDAYEILQEGYRVHNAD